MKIQVLIDNIAGACGSRKLFGEWGLSVYVEFEDKRYLLDTGASHLFAKNAGVMGVDLSKVDMGVLSHAHFDHSDGMAKFFHVNEAAPFYLRKGAGENCYHTHKLIGRFTYHEYIGIHKGFLKRFADRIRFAEGDMQIAPNVYLVPHKTPGLSAIGERAHLSVKENGKYAVVSDGYKVVLSDEKQERLAAKNVAEQDVILGVRPDHIVLGDGGIKGKVEVSELMGPSCHLHLDVDGKDVIAIIPTEGKPVDYINKEVGLTFNGNVCHVFSKDDQLNLEY